MSFILEIVAMLACVVGAGMGLYAMVNPGWGAKLVRLQPAEGTAGGFAEFRATYGGLFAFSHLGALLGVLATGPSFSAIFCFPLAAGWVGAGVGRLMSIAFDGTGTKFNTASVIFEFAMGIALFLPLIVLF
jgi:hypothetical protein